METDLHLQISQLQASLKHENFKLSSHSYTTLLPQNVLQLQKHVSVHFTASTIWGWQKLGLVGMVSLTELPLHVPNYKMFLILSKFECSCFSWPNFDLVCCNLHKYL